MHRVERGGLTCRLMDGDLLRPQKSDQPYLTLDFMLHRSRAQSMSSAPSTTVCPATSRRHYASGNLDGECEILGFASCSSPAFKLHTHPKYQLDWRTHADKASPPQQPHCFLNRNHDNAWRAPLGLDLRTTDAEAYGEARTFAS